MSLRTDDTGLYFEIDLPNTTKGNDIAELVRTGIVGGCSFGFTIADQDLDFQRDGLPLHTITQIGKLFEITFTPIPAYPTTEVVMRSIEAARNEAVVEEPTAEVTEEVVASEEVVTEEVTEEVTAEASNEEVEAPSADETVVESQPLATTKAEIDNFLLSLLN